MTPIHLNIPDSTLSYGDYAQAHITHGNIALLHAIQAQYGLLIQRFAQANQIDAGIVASFIATESSGKMVTRPNSPYKGLMQIAAAPLYDCITRWNWEVKTGSLPTEVFREIQSKCPELLSKRGTDKLTPALQNKLGRLLQTDPSFNIMGGTTYLRWLLERFHGQFNKVITAYNAGHFLKPLMQKGTTKPNPNPVDTATLVHSSLIPNESRNYLLKMLGKQGYCELWFKNIQPLV